MPYENLRICARSFEAFAPLLKERRTRKELIRLEIEEYKARKSIFLRSHFNISGFLVRYGK